MACVVSSPQAVLSSILTSETRSFIMGSINKETDDYVLGRGIRESIRLDAQHLLWKLHLGYALHPSIKRSEPLRIAEVGTGTAIWLLDLAQDLPLDTQFHGYDISANQFPPQALWPENLDLGILNALEDPPSRLLGYYDVVHVRMWASNLRSREASILIRNLKAMLKPGGFIQWEDADLVDQHLQSQPAQELEVVAKDLFKKAGIDYR
ncbi:N-methyltransferase tcpN like protein [Verticillium longisporum]|uniref:N-methyltransferase tcpN like protein n=1 Tax=Verticillium longisporum TaxID=100787 RepID=A0A8I3AS71_VERLO|nr:N-methyltransferase tcpN like protein [Verticillium longisporum]